MSIYQKMLQVQKSIQVVTTNKKGAYGKYADLGQCIAAIRKPLNDAGLLLTQEFSVSGDPEKTLNIVTQVINPRDNGEPETITHHASWPITKLNVQQVGSARTYLSRYALTTLFVLPISDDDGAEALQAQLSGEESEGDDFESALKASGASDKIALLKFFGLIQNDEQAAFNEWQQMSRKDKKAIFPMLPEEIQDYMKSPEWAMLGGKDGTAE